MKLRLVPPNHGDKKKEELKRKIAEQKARFEQASTRAADVIKNDLSITRWVQEYPLETTLFAVASGIILAQTLEKILNGRRPLQPPPLRSI